jgi:hypothetical protein
MAETADQSHLDAKYFIDEYTYNCPFCNRRHVSYHLSGKVDFDWKVGKKCYVYFVQCDSCSCTSLHYSYDDIKTEFLGHVGGQAVYRFDDPGNLDSRIFYSVPTSFFVLDDRIPKIIRELITEAEGSRKMNFLTGASACARKAIYEFLVKEGAEGDHYEDKIKSLKTKFPAGDPDLFDVLGHIQDMTSDKVHEQSWPKWDSANLTLIIETLKAVLHEVYVVPEERSGRSGKIRELLAQVRGKTKAPENQAPPGPPEDSPPAPPPTLRARRTLG